MQSIAALVSGIAGAEDGSVQLFRRGTSTRATWYADFEASSPDTTGADIPLDGHGGATIYVNELVTVRALSSGGTVIREFVAGDASGAVEVRSPSFTGVDYESGASAPGNPTDLATVLDRWKTGSGAVDWKVLVGGAALSIEDAMSEIAGLVFNVKSSAYGAVGDGVVDDSGAINTAALAASAAGGGTVFFPAGNYRITQSIPTYPYVNFVGVPAATTITDTGGVSIFSDFGLSDVNAAPVLIAHLILTATVTCSADVIYVTGVRAMTIRDVRVETNAYFTAHVFHCTASNGNFLFENCWLAAYYSEEVILITGGSGLGVLRVVNSYLGLGSLLSSGSIISSGLHYCFLEGNYCFNGGFSGPLLSDSTGSYAIIATGNYFDGGNPVTGGGAFALVGGESVFESGNFWPAGYPVMQSAGSIPSQVVSKSRWTHAVASNADSTYTIPDGTSLLQFYSTNVSGPALTLPALEFRGQELEILIYNNSGSDWAAVTIATTIDQCAIAAADRTTTLLRSELRYLKFIAEDLTADGTLVWVLVQVG